MNEIADNRRMQPADESLLVQLLQSLVGSRAELMEYQVANHRPDYWVLLVRTKQPQLELVVKLAGRNATLAHPFDRTAFLHRLVGSQTSLAMPEVIAWNMSFETCPWRYLITSYVWGQEWAVVRQTLDANDLRDAYRELGNAIGMLHRITFPKFGELSAHGVVAAPSFGEALATHAARIIRQPEHVGVFLALLEARSDLFADVPTPCLCHDDLHQHNILFDQHNGRLRLATILDLDKAWAGPAESDLARLALWQGMTNNSFWDAYSKLHTLDDAFQQRKAIYQLLWCLEYAVASPQHNADTTRVCHALGIEPIRFS